MIESTLRSGPNAIVKTVLFSFALMSTHICVCSTFGVMVLNTVGPTETLSEIGLLTLETYASAT